MSAIKAFALCSAALNLIAFIGMAVDKRRALRNAYRIPEKFFLKLSLLSGGIGVIIGMILFRHKIRKPLFFVWIPLITALVWSALGFMAVQFNIIHV